MSEAGFVTQADLVPVQPIPGDERTAEELIEKYYPEDANRLKRMRVSPLLLESLCHGVYRVVQNEIPQGASIVRVGWDRERQCFDLILHSHKFEAIKEGDDPPDMEGPTIQQITA